MRRLFIFKLLNLLVLSGALVVCTYAYTAANRYFAPDTVFMTTIGSTHPHTHNIDAVRQIFHDYTVTASSRGVAVVSTPSHVLTVPVTYTDSDYFAIHLLNFSQGAAWQDETYSIVLNEALAWRLFGTTDIVGAPVFIDDRPHIVTGVVRPFVMGDYMAWMPFSVQQAPLPITAMYARARYYNPVDAAVHSQRMIRTQFGMVSEYVVVDINRFTRSINMRARGFMYLLWLYGLVLLVRFVIKRAPTFTQENIKSIIKTIGLPALGILIVSYILLTAVTDVLYWLPNLGIQGVSVIESFTNIGVLPPDEHLSYGLRRLGWFNRMANLAWVVGAVAFVNFIFVPQPKQ